MTLQGRGSSGDGQSSQILSWHGSLYNMTLNELQNHLGENLHIMNLDELLKFVFAIETNQLPSMDLDCPLDQHASISGLHSQGSINMSRELCKKTVDEVWKDIQKKGNGVQRSGYERQLTLGEMTLEDFLLKAGVIGGRILENGTNPIGNDDPLGNSDLTHRTQDFTQVMSWSQQSQQVPVMDQQLQGQQSMLEAFMPNHPLPQSMGAGAEPMCESVFPEGQMNISSPTLGAHSDSQTSGMKRGTSEDTKDKLAERRQEKILKNRESAARSRARKQAYTNELENQVSRLQEENEKLKKQKELDCILSATPRPEPRYQLRRTSSASNSWDDHY